MEAFDWLSAPLCHLTSLTEAPEHLETFHNAKELLEAERSSQQPKETAQNLIQIVYY